MSSRSLQSQRHIRQCTARRQRLGMTPNMYCRGTVRRDFRRSERYSLIELLSLLLIHTITRTRMAVRIEAPKDDITRAKGCICGRAIRPVRGSTFGAFL